MENIKIYAKTIESEAIEQIQHMANSVAYKDCTIRIMPDCHSGKGCTVGTVINIKDKVVPNTVGVDIGCGMLVYNLGNIFVDVQKLDEVINAKVPSGFASHETPIVEFPKLKNLHCVDNINLSNAMRQIGSLGGGNHFIELNIDKNNNKYLVIHSGSRHLGVEVCSYYQHLAYKMSTKTGLIRKEIIEKLKSEGREKEIQNELSKIKNTIFDKELAHLDGEYYKMYLDDMSIAQQYASLNRKTIADIIVKEMGWGIEDSFETIHNYIDIKNNILRKGAVSAMDGELLIIPINMHDGSLICMGKGNKDWLYSAPHGAGRLMSRTKAKETLSMSDYKNAMIGIYSSSVCESTLDEAPMAYKSIEEIMEAIEPTVNIITKIRPIYNFKAK
jgi:RNA-splicing ligase RtcB